MHSLAHVMGDTFLSLDFGKLMGSRGGRNLQATFCILERWWHGCMAGPKVWAGIFLSFPWRYCRSIYEHSSLFLAHLRATIAPEVHTWPVVLSLG